MLVLNSMHGRVIFYVDCEIRVDAKNASFAVFRLWIYVHVPTRILRHMYTKYDPPDNKNVLLYKSRIAVHTDKSILYSLLK